MTKEAINQQIGARIRSVRKSHKLTLLELADKVGLSEGNIQRYEAGKIANVSIALIEKFATALGVHPAVLMGWQNDATVGGEPLIPREKTLVHKYRRLPDGGKDDVDGFVDYQLEKAERERDAQKKDSAAS